MPNENEFQMGELDSDLGTTRDHEELEAMMQGRAVQKIRRGFRLILLTVLAGTLIYGCSKEHSLDSVRNPSDPGVTGLTPPVPNKLNARVSSRQVELVWQIPDSSQLSNVDKFFVYLQEPGVSDRLIDSTTTPPVTITGLDNGTLYRFQVSSVLQNRLEGQRSTGITAAPAIFGIVIDGGREKTRFTQVTLGLQAPGGTQGMKLSNVDDLEEIGVRPFSSVLSWDLPPGDGPKEVFVQFFDNEGNLSHVFSNQIEIDTRAEIQSVSFTPSVAAPGQTLQLTLDAGEPHGTADVLLGDRLSIPLYDDGTNGDVSPGDGIYQRAYVIEQDVELFEVLVTGRFTDEVGNVGESRIASGRLTVHKSPDPVVLLAPTSSSPQELTLSWTPATDATRFSAYRVYRDTEPGVAESMTRLEVHEQRSRTTTSYTDRSLEPGTTYYYVVEVVDEIENAAASNEVSGTPRANVPPDPIVLQTPSEVSERSITLTFGRSFASDFAEYQVYRGLQEDLANDPDLRLLTKITSATNTRHVDSDEIEQNQTYYYAVDVVDELGAATRSNVVSTTTPDRIPASVSLNTPTSIGERSILLTWSRNSDQDFEAYEIRRSLEAGVSASSPLVVRVDDADRTDHLDTGLIENTDYYYRVFVVDRGSNASGSNELKTKTANADPDPVVLASPSEDGGAATPTLELDWSSSDAHDFESYRVFRDTAPAVSEASDLVRTVFEPDATSFVDAGLADNTRYYYRVFVDDDAGGVSGSNEQVVITANRAPKPVELQVSSTTPTSIALSWTQNNDSDFDQYRLMQGTSDSNFPTVAAEFTQREQTGHTVFVAATDSTVYFFKVVVFDQDIDSSSRLSSDSNIVSAQAGD